MEKPLLSGRSSPLGPIWILKGRLRQLRSLPIPNPGWTRWAIRSSSMRHNGFLSSFLFSGARSIAIDPATADLCFWVRPLPPWSARSPNRSQAAQPSSISRLFDGMRSCIERPRAVLSVCGCGEGFPGRSSLRMTVRDRTGWRLIHGPLLNGTSTSWALTSRLLKCVDYGRCWPIVMVASGMHLSWRPP